MSYSIYYFVTYVLNLVVIFIQVAQIYKEVNNITISDIKKISPPPQYSLPTSFFLEAIVFNFFDWFLKYLPLHLKIICLYL